VSLVEASFRTVRALNSRYSFSKASDSAPFLQPNRPFSYVPHLGCDFQETPQLGGILPPDICIMDINSSLLPFFSRPTEFRSVQANSKALLVGPFAKACFLPMDPPPVLEIAVEQGDSGEIEAFLQNDAYIVSAAEEEFKYILPGGLDYGTCLVKTYGIKTEERSKSVKLIILDRGPAIGYVLRLRYHKRMNFISWNIAYSLYPQSLGDEDFNCLDWRELRELEEQPKRQHLKEGKKVLHRHKDITCPRHVGDNQTQKINLDMTNVLDPKIADGILESATFQIEFNKDIGLLIRPSIIISSPALKYQYHVNWLSEDLEYSAKLWEIVNLVASWSEIELNLNPESSKHDVTYLVRQHVVMLLGLRELQTLCASNNDRKLHEERARLDEKIVEHLLALHELNIRPKSFEMRFRSLWTRDIMGK
jgi:hypothetical protein